MVFKQVFKRPAWCCFLMAMILCASGVANGESETPPSKDDTVGVSHKVSNLTDILDAMDTLSGEIVSVRNLLESPEGKGREELLNSRLSQLNQKLFTLETNFNELASEVNVADIGKSKDDNFDLAMEIKEILGPVIRELQRATSRPREIERHRSDIERFNQQLDLINKAMARIQSLMAAPSATPKLREYLDRTLATLKSRQNEIETLKNISSLQLEKLSGSNESFSDTVKKLPKMFFKSHGSNLLLSMLSFIVMAFAFFRLHRLIGKVSPFHKNRTSFYVRVFDLSYGVVSTMICLGVLLSVLYYLSDWVLLSLILVFILGLAWTSKEAFPRFWNQARLILNLGPVREGELIVYNGVSYRVLSLNLYTFIYNPAMSCGKIRLPIADLLGMRSRTVTENEPWFPSREGDWVLLDSEHPARVISQTPETVVVEMIGGARSSYTTAGYLAATPVNLSSGFRIKLLFGLDYNLQRIITTQVPGILKQAVENELFKAGFRESMKFIRTDFKQAASSSLDIEISADFSGSSARDYVQIKRLMQRACVDTCNAENWTIPFNQLTVHMEPQ